MARKARSKEQILRALHQAESGEPLAIYPDRTGISQSLLTEHLVEDEILRLKSRRRLLYWAHD